jgi:hypothetical protein
MCLNAGGAAAAGRGIGDADSYHRGRLRWACRFSPHPRPDQQQRCLPRHRHGQRAGVCDGGSLRPRRHNPQSWRRPCQLFTPRCRWRGCVRAAACVHASPPPYARGV